MKKYTQYYAGSLSNIDESDIRSFLREANEKMKNKRLEKLHISVEPTMVSKEFLKILKQYNVITVELEVKIANNFILKKYNANFVLEDIKKASKLIKRSRMNLGYELMVGFPDSTKIDEIESVKYLMKFRPKVIRLYPVLVIEGTDLAQAYRNKEYEPLTLTQAVERCKDIIYMFNKKKIKEITVVDINEENLNKGEISVIAGPTHKDFPQLVEDSIWYDSIVARIKKYNSKVKEVKVEVHPVNVNNAIGYEKENQVGLKNMQDYYQCKQIEEIYQKVLEDLYASNANVVILQIQDILKQNETSRMNTPGKASNNWQYRVLKENLNEHLFDFIKELTQKYGRE